MVNYTLQSKYVRSSAAGFILNNNGQIYLMRRGQEPHKGKWMMPGGHMKVGETIEECVKREIKEEVGMEVSIDKLFTVYSDPTQDTRNHVLVVFFIVKPIFQEDIETIETMDSKWFDFKDVPEELAYHHRKVFDQFLKEYNK